MTISTAGSDYDTLLGVYAGTVLSSLRSVASNDDQSGSILTSRVSFRATAGTTYQIAVDGYHGAAGHIVLNFSAPGPAATSRTAAALSPSAVDRAIAELLYGMTQTQNGVRR